MAAFGVGQTHVTSVPWIDVDGLLAGTYRFRLEVDDAAGNASAPSEIVVTVLAPPQPQPQPQPRIPIERIPIERAPRIPDWKLGRQF